MGGWGVQSPGVQFHGGSVLRGLSPPGVQSRGSSPKVQEQEQEQKPTKKRTIQGFVLFLGLCTITMIYGGFRGFVLFLGASPIQGLSFRGLSFWGLSF